MNFPNDFLDYILKRQHAKILQVWVSLVFRHYVLYYCDVSFFLGEALQSM